MTDDDARRLERCARRRSRRHLGSAEVAVKAAGRAVDAIPKPDVRDDPNFQRLAGLEQSMLARLSPRHRNRWPELVAIDDRLEDPDRRQGELHTTLGDLHQRRQRADDDYAAVMYAWMEDGKPDPKPTPLAQGLDDAIAEASAEHGARPRTRYFVTNGAYSAAHAPSLVAPGGRGNTARARRMGVGVGGRRSVV